MNKKTGIGKKNAICFTICLSVISLIIFLVINKDNIIKITEIFPKCTFYRVTGLMCPACGNTRSVIALLRGDIVLSLRYNAVPIVIIILSCVAYLELFTFSVGSHIKIFPRSFFFLYFLLLSAVIYFIARNFFPI
ncbi:MAG: DUF2752 domain-containing protein [Clostridia bacterium]|nr:DUF2752 domain-containing protein [Clostridia bacterium]